MSRISFTLTAALALATFAAGCGAKKEADKASGDKTAATDKPAADKPAAGGAVKLPKLGLVIDAPGEVTVSDAIVGEGHMVQGGAIGALSVQTGATPQTLDEAKEEAKMFTPANVKADTLPDGWALSFENKGAAGANYFVEVRRTIDGKLLKCTTTGTEAGQAAAVLAACKSLRKG